MDGDHEDPVFFTRHGPRAHVYAASPVIASCHACNENNKDVEHLRPISELELQARAGEAGGK